jgi:hypothetical protein
MAILFFITNFEAIKVIKRLEIYQLINNKFNKIKVL